ncbi:glycerophosphodiester phosphodiesterase [Nonomuraea zeae]|uniref:Glycerophosphodiester phosphodiesterase n=1 Tax=Nonomuraea zeae TaxID=1642303 RepID=A0A5S4F1A5_9ACTN|nr:glycerophosphodiester phosphodiesterase family protein [Nonomuraea zeae]TMR09862.1 glycerophosphodiester phosphodiesterase [Nonomuraea zeae]
MIALAAPAAVTAAAFTSSREVDNIAHRGGSALAPENTIAACALAMAQGADVCEFDIQQTKDHQLILMHDQTLARTTNVEQVFPRRSPWRVSDFTLAEIRRLDAGSWFSPRFRGEGVPTLAQGLQAMSHSKVGLLLEVKHAPSSPDIDKRVAAELQEARTEWGDERLAVQAFDWRAMRTFHHMRPHIPISLLGKPPADRLSELAGYVKGINLPHAGLTAEYVKKAHKQGMKVYTGTTHKPAVIRRLMSYGVDGIMTNRPRRLANVKLRLS